MMPPPPGDEVVVWNIIHDSTMTEHVISFLEYSLSGVKFLTGYDIPNMILEEEEHELQSIMQTLSILPENEDVEEEANEEEGRKVWFTSVVASSVGRAGEPDSQGGSQGNNKPQEHNGSAPQSYPPNQSQSGNGSNTASYPGYDKDVGF